jgi:uncharacterized membrane protein YeaQ/YmgE (transglycosylase-associated protein family)
MAILGWIMRGLIVGVVPKLLTPKHDPGGMIVTIALGIVGALIGGFLGHMLGWYREEDPIGSIIPVIGAMVVLFVYRQTAPCRYF